MNSLWCLLDIVCFVSSKCSFAIAGRGMFDGDLVTGFLNLEMWRTDLLMSLFYSSHYLYHLWNGMAH